MTVALLSSSKAELETATTDGTGVYSFTSRPAGVYYVQVKTPAGGYAALPSSDSRFEKQVILGAGSSESGADLVVKGTGGSIAGVLFDDIDLNATYGSGDALIGGITVQLKLKATGAVLSEVLADSGTGYSFQNLPSGIAYQVTIKESTVPTGVYGFITGSDGNFDTPKKNNRNYYCFRSYYGKRFCLY